MPADGKAKWTNFEKRRNAEAVHATRRTAARNAHATAETAVATAAVAAADPVEAMAAKAVARKAANADGTTGVTHPQRTAAALETLGGTVATDPSRGRYTRRSGRT